MLIALVNCSLPGSAWKNPLCNSFNIETGGGGTKILFFQQGSNTFVRDCRPLRQSVTFGHTILLSNEEINWNSNESTSFILIVGYKFAGCYLNIYECSEVRQLRSQVVLPNENFQLKYLYGSWVQFSYEAKETLLLLIFHPNIVDRCILKHFFDFSTNCHFWNIISSKTSFSS